MDWYLTIKTIHIISSAVLFGTGAGIAFEILLLNIMAATVPVAISIGTQPTEKLKPFLGINGPWSDFNFSVGWVPMLVATGTVAASFVSTQIIHAVSEWFVYL